MHTYGGTLCVNPGIEVCPAAAAVAAAAAAVAAAAAAVLLAHPVRMKASS